MNEQRVPGSCVALDPLQEKEQWVPPQAQPRETEAYVKQGVEGLSGEHACVGRDPWQSWSDRCPDRRFADPPAVGQCPKEFRHGGYPFMPSWEQLGCPDDFPDRTCTCETNSAFSQRTE